MIWIQYPPKSSTLHGTCRTSGRNIWGLCSKYAFYHCLSDQFRIVGHCVHFAYCQKVSVNLYRFLNFEPYFILWGRFVLCLFRKRTFLPFLDTRGGHTFENVSKKALDFHGKMLSHHPYSSPGLFLKRPKNWDKNQA